MIIIKKYKNRILVTTKWRQSMWDMAEIFDTCLRSETHSVPTFASVIVAPPPFARISSVSGKLLIILLNTSMWSSFSSWMKSNCIRWTLLPSNLATCKRRVEKSVSFLHRYSLVIVTTCKGRVEVSQSAFCTVTVLLLSQPVRGG